MSFLLHALTHWGRVTHICVSKLTIIGSDNGLSPDRRQAIIWTNAGLLLIGPLGTNFNEILIEILTFSFKKMRLKMSSAKRRPFCPGLNVLNSAEVGHGWEITSNYFTWTSLLVHAPIPMRVYSIPVNARMPRDAYMRRWTMAKLVQIMVLSPGRHQAITWTNAGLLSIGTSGTNFSEFFNRNSNIFIQEIAI